MKNEKQHYVPQYYLKNFSFDNYLFVLDIPSLKVYKSNIRDIGCEKYYHNTDIRLIKGFIENIIEEDYIDKRINVLVENNSASFLRIFSVLSDLLKSLPQKTPINVPDKVLELLMHYIIIQYIRSPKYKAILEPIANKTKERLESYQKKLPFKITKENIHRLIHNINLYITMNKLVLGEVVFFKEELVLIREFALDFIDKLEKNLLNSGRIFFLNRTVKNFFTSDSPVAFDWVQLNEGTFKMCYFPIHKKLSVMFFSKDELINAKPFDRAIYIISEEKREVLDNLNLFTTKFAHRKVFCEKSDFHLVNKFVKGEIKAQLKIW